MRFSLKVKKSSLWLGRILVLASLAFVLHKLKIYKESINEIFVEPRIYVFMPIFFILYGFAGILLSQGWITLLRAQGVKPVTLSWKEAFHLYGVTQIAKYIPGNIFHFAGRHTLAYQKGVLHAHLFLAAALEILFILFSAITISLLIIGRTIQTYDDTIIPFLFVFIAIGVILVLVLSFRKHTILKSIKHLDILKVAISFISYLSFIIFSCLLFFCTVVTVSGQTTCMGNWPSIMGGYAFAWAVGFVIPGAPGGIGVREATLISLLASTLSEPDLIVSALAFRLITIVGDIVFFSLSMAIQIHTNSIRFFK